jgi:hypothetical protein
MKYAGLLSFLSWIVSVDAAETEVSVGRRVPRTTELGRSARRADAYDSYDLRAARALASLERSKPMDRRAVERKLAVLSLEDFCSSAALLDVQGFLVEQLAFDSSVYLSENESFLCVCAPPVVDATDLTTTTTVTSVTLRCSTMYGILDENNEPLDDAPIVDLEFMVLTADRNTDSNSNTTTLYPIAVSWRTLDDGDLNSELPFGEDFTLVSPTATATSTAQIEACETVDAFCDSVCNVCPGNITVSIEAEPDNTNCFNVTCEEEYHGAFLFDYHLENNLAIDIPDDLSAADPCTMAGPDSTFPRAVDDFCSPVSLADVAATATQAFADFSSLVDGEAYDCTCVLPSTSDDTILLQCVLEYAFDGTPFTNTETLTLAPSPLATMARSRSVYAVSTLGWCDAEEGMEAYCESYTIAYGQDTFASCTINGCDAGFCELCADARFVGHSCNFGQPCADAGAGSFLNVYRQLRLVTQACPTDMPTGVPNSMPTSMPLTTSMPLVDTTSSPTQTPSTTVTTPPSAAAVPYQATGVAVMTALLVLAPW